MSRRRMVRDDSEIARRPYSAEARRVAFEAATVAGKKRGYPIAAAIDAMHDRSRLGFDASIRFGAVIDAFYNAARRLGVEERDIRAVVQEALRGIEKQGLT